MNIELRKIKYAAFASEETNCFKAEIWVDGKREGYAENDGHGGMTFISPRSLEEKINAYAATLPPIVTDINDDSEPSGKFTFQPKGETIVDDLLSSYLTERDLARLLQKHILYTVAGKVGIYRTKGAKAGQLDAWLRDPRLAEKLKADRILNVMPPAERLLLFKAQA